MGKKILIVGGDEILGESLIRYFTNNTDHEIISVTPDISHEGETGLSFADIFDKDKLKEISYELAPEIIINTAEYSGIDECEENKQKANDYNFVLTKNLVRIANIIDADYVGFSSDLIFDGDDGPYSEKSRPAPKNYYGRTKHAAENVVRTEAIPWAIVRTSSPFGLSKFGKQDFVFDIVSKLNKGEEIRLSDKVLRSPIYADDVAVATAAIIDKRSRGIFNVAGSKIVNQYEFAVEIAEKFGFDKNLIIKTDEVQKYIPLNCGLINHRAIRKLEIEISSASSALDALSFLYEQYKVLERES